MYPLLEKVDFQPAMLVYRRVAPTSTRCFYDSNNRYVHLLFFLQSISPPDPLEESMPQSGSPNEGQTVWFSGDTWRVSKKIGVPRNGWFMMETATLKWMIWWETHYFWKHPLRLEKLLFWGCNLWLLKNDDEMMAPPPEKHKCAGKLCCRNKVSNWHAMQRIYKAWYSV